MRLVPQHQPVHADAQCQPRAVGDDVLVAPVPPPALLRVGAGACAHVKGVSFEGALHDLPQCTEDADVETVLRVQVAEACVDHKVHRHPAIGVLAPWLALQSAVVRASWKLMDLQRYMP